MGLTLAQAAEILGTTQGYVKQLVHRGRLPRPVKWERAGLPMEVVESLALERFRPHHPYWCDSREAATILAVSQRRACQLAHEGKVPAVLHRGRWYFRRRQLDVVANARLSRRAPLATAHRALSES